MLVADSSLTPIPQAAAPQRAAPCERPQLAKTVARPVFPTTILLARNLWDVADAGGLVEKIVEEVDNGE